MKLNNLFCLFIPPIFLRIFRKKQIKNYWSGIYGKFSDIENLNTYNNIDLSSDLINAAKEFKNIPGDIFSKSLTIFPHNSIMSIICLINGVYKKGDALNVIDFGGGAAIEYLYIKKTIKKEIRLKYTVIEFDALKEAIISFQEDWDRVEFLPTFPEDYKADIVFSSAAIQYIDDWKSMVAKFCNVNAKFIVLLRLVAGKNPTFVARQENLTGYYLPYRFFNWEEVVLEFKKNGYELGFLSSSEKQYSQDNYPEKYRIERPCNLIFVKEA